MLTINSRKLASPLFLDAAYREPIHTVTAVGRIHGANINIQVQTLLLRLTVRHSTPITTNSANVAEQATAAVKIA